MPSRLESGTFISKDDLREACQRKDARIEELKRRTEKARSLLLDDEWNTSAALRVLAGKGDDRAR